ncbi:MAG: anthranilate phosphoribosyltransferase [Planctomycetaceae bacterium]|jgi:anthranilate phosphoribosyltransferase|nr:anthranilate phosphoribosyltransferase [Planctomycetaceae bacterium]
MELTFSQRCQQYINQLLRKENLTSGEMENFFNAVLESSDTALSEEENTLLASFLTAMAVKGETVQELAGAARGMRYHAEKIQVLGSPIVDIVGTGGDGIHTINVSTTSSFVIAGAGLVVAKHGNRAVSSKCGSADVLEALGVNLKLPKEQVEECVANIGIGFLFAQQFHPSMRRVAPLRKRLGFRTLFNLLGPLTNPAGANCAVIGVYDLKQTEMFAEVLRELGCRRAMVVHGYDGMDELTMTTRSRVTELVDGRLRTYDFFPELYFDGELAVPEDIRGGDAKENADILKGILKSEIRGGKRSIVLLNSAAAIYCAEKAKTMEEAIQIAIKSVDSGAALDKLDKLVGMTNTSFV